MLSKILLAIFCINFFVAVQGQVSSSCGGDLTDISGTILSPNYPNNYDDNLDCTWTITVPEGKIIRVVFDDFSLESEENCQYDSLTLDDGGSNNKIFCGENPNTTFVSATNTITIRFRTDGSVQSSGFKLVYEDFQAAPCGGHFEAQSATIVSPNFPNNYDDDMDCFWTILVPEGKQISITFSAFSLEPHENCDYDNLTINYGFPSNDTPALCGDSLPASYISETNSLIVRFRTDGSVQSSGFNFTYNTVDACREVFTAASGVIKSPNYPENYNNSDSCTWEISVEQGKRIQLTFVDFETESSDTCNFDYLDIGAESDARYQQAGKYCGPVPIHSVISDSNTMRLVFQSDGSITFRGFHLVYATVDAPAVSCGGVLAATETEGVITSPGYPSLYENGLNCLWDIRSAEGKKVQLTVDTFSLEGSSTCAYDVLEVFDFVSQSEVSVNEYCGHVAPSTMITSTGDRLMVRFGTDGSVVSSGFSIRYQSIDALADK